jgi:protoporphyrinogen oxidase
MTQTPVTLIVGAGLTGLAAGIALARQGVPCLLAERESAVGGMARSLTMDGVTFDMGPHVIFPDATPAGRLVGEALGRVETVSRPFAFSVFAQGRHWKFPNHFDALTYPWRDMLDLAATLLRRPSGPLLSARDELRARTGPRLYDRLFRETLGKKTGTDPTAVHRHWLMRPDRTATNTLEPPPSRSTAAVVRAALKRLRREYVYPAAGFGALPDALHALYAEAGGRTLLDCGDIALTASAGAVTAATLDGTTMPVSRVVWTGPLDQLGRALGQPMACPDFADILLVFLTCEQDRLQPRPFVYTYHPDPAVAFNRVSYPANQRPLPDREGVCLEITVAPDATDHACEHLAEQAVADSASLGLYPAHALRVVRTLRLRRGLPLYPLGYEETLRSAYAPVRAMTNVLSVGRQGGWFFCMSPQAVAQGLKAAARITGEEKTP